MIREWPYTASNRDELGCTAPPTSRFPSSLGKSLGRRGCKTQYIPPLGSIRIQYSICVYVHMYIYAIYTCAYIYFIYGVNESMSNQVHPDCALSSLSCIDHEAVVWTKYGGTGIGVSENLNNLQFLAAD